jgi:hypothetical protein
MGDDFDDYADVDNDLDYLFGDKYSDASSYFDSEGNYDPHYKNHLPTRWKQKDGKLVPIMSLDDRHLENIINLLMNRNKRETPIFKAMIAERNRRIRARESEKSNTNVFVMRKPADVIAEQQKKKKASEKRAN